MAYMFFNLLLFKEMALHRVDSPIYGYESAGFFVEDFVPTKHARTYSDFKPSLDTLDSDGSTEAESTTNLKKKTEMCRNWETKGYCSWGAKCSYAHGEHELQKKNHVPKNYLTRSCVTFHKQGICSFGKRCQFMHSERDVYQQ